MTDQPVARGLRVSRIMEQARNAISRKISNLAWRLVARAGQKALVAWQGLPGAVAMEAVACR
jgi:hypothetical protein